MRSWDVIFVGGGLANGLAAWRLRERRPRLRLLVLEGGPTLGGNHTWSFHTTDLSPPALAWIRPLSSRSWEGHEVRFPSFRRRLRGGYHSIQSDHFDRVLREKLGDAVRLGATAVEVESHEVRLATGERLTAGCVVDGRGLGSFAEERAGYQKFLGLDVRLDAPHGLTAPILMDATVEQRDGYRFLYVLPWTEDTMLLEDTRYSDTPPVAVEECRRAIRDYACARGWRIREILREEVGSLPIPLTEDFAGPARTGAPRLGLAAGCFHPTTGYSLPDAVRLAWRLGELPSLTPGDVRAAVRRYVDERRGSWAYLRFLNRMLFRAAAPEERRRIFERFYRLGEGRIERFYAGELPWGDRMRILLGKPPIPIHRALRGLKEEAGAWKPQATFG